MTMDNNPNPANEPNAFPPNPTQLPSKPGLPEKEGDEKVDRIDRAADHLAHKGAKTQQDFEKENSSLLTI
ncbi:MAG: hypothetical protein ACLPY1_04370 [Terracidiphilus sp.]